ncbi:hypothetical protein QNE49_001367 [Vibrio fluvialis]|nr:hypothetical protein [Vibrio fluvialis]MBY7782998.1 hypothetical protein [Vibrio fluvialis]
MYEHELPEELLDTYKLPKKIKISAWFLAFSILAVGAWAGLHWNDWVHFARSGAVLVVLSLSLAAFGFGNNFIDRVLFLVKPATAKIIEIQSNNHPHLYGIHENLTDKEKSDLIHKVSRERINQVHVLMKNRMAKDVQKIEFLIAALGTLVWGFGDLVGRF